MISRERERVCRQLLEIAQGRLLARLLAATPAEEMEAPVEKVVTRRLDPYAAADLLVQRLR